MLWCLNWLAIEVHISGQSASLMWHLLNLLTCCLTPASSSHVGFTTCLWQIWDTALRMLCKYRGLQDPPQFREFMEVQVGMLARKPVRARCGCQT